MCNKHIYQKAIDKLSGHPESTIKLSDFQRFLKISYFTASKLVSKLEQDGFLALPDNLGHRAILQGKLTSIIKCSECESTEIYLKKMPDMVINKVNPDGSYTFSHYFHLVQCVHCDMTDQDIGLRFDSDLNKVVPWG